MLVCSLCTALLIPALAQAQQAAPAAAAPAAAAPAAAAPAKPKPLMVAVGQPIGEFALVDDQGRNVNEKSLSGKPTALVFFQTACSMCAAEVADAREIAGRNKNFELVLVSIDMRTPADKFEGYRKNYAGDSPIWTDPKFLLPRRFSVSATPAMALIDGKGNLKEVRVGYSSGEKDELEKALKDLK
jgi:cytochrome oxidase Cu insertion factor (SCO1/SenC/PrrC family)